ncbi:hypothetical protein ECAI27_43130 [Escherichia coli AI27]|nr:hypothetical protein ECAI27_43130 [Escherichia coli AI27]
MLTHERPVYPRWRGEHVDWGYLFRRPGGLSPLARGTLCAKIDPLANRRFIPAGAGNTLSIHICF